jgi:transcription elongation factor
VAALPKASFTPTVNDWATPAVVAGNPDTVNDAAVTGAMTLIPGWVATIAAFAVSAAVMDWTPGVSKVALNVWTPESFFVNV